MKKILLFLIAFIAMSVHFSMADDGGMAKAGGRSLSLPSIENKVEFNSDFNY